MSETQEPYVGKGEEGREAMTTLQKAARAAWQSWADANRRNGNILAVETWEDEPHKEDVYESVRAVLLAIREPEGAVAEAMRREFNRVQAEKPDWVPTDTMLWQVGIDAILAEEKK